MNKFPKITWLNKKKTRNQKENADMMETCMCNKFNWFFEI